MQDTAKLPDLLTGSDGVTSSNKLNFLQIGLIACYSVGFNGFTSFPYYIHRHSGFFLVIYYVLAIVICIPVCYIQIKVGALYRRGLVGIFINIVPILKGVGVALLFVTYIHCLLHGVELTYGLYYMFACLKQPYSWAPNAANGTKQIETTYHLAAEKFFNVEFLQRSVGIGSPGPVLWYLFLTSMGTWIFVYLCVFKGLMTWSRICYIFTPVTFLVLSIVLIFGYVEIPSSVDSLHHIMSDAHAEQQTISLNTIAESVKNRLASPRAWIDGLQLHMYNLGLWAGVLPTLGNRVYNCKSAVNATWIVLLLVHNLLPVIVILALAPYMDHHSIGGDMSNGQGLKPGLSLLFISIPHVLEKLKITPFISFCIYLAFIMFGLHHISLHLLTILENLIPALPKRLVSLLKKREIIIAVFCFVSFVLSIGYNTKCGIYLYMIIYDYIDRLLFTLIIFSAVPFITGYIRQNAVYVPMERLCMGIWYGVSSLITAALLIYYFAVYIYPNPILTFRNQWIEYVGWAVAVSPIFCCVLPGAIHSVYSEEGTLHERFMKALKTENTPDFGSQDGYDSVETGDTGLHGKKKLSTGSTPIGCEELEKSLVEVSITPDENGEIVNV